jgi:D-beta-D-heptose 7-phosphate kinase/D-beta-D-heptose 1-phosphate adenosyltransferase
MNFLIIGDIMLDIYYISSSNRIAPEASIPVFRNNKIIYKLGGAANVALNLKSLNCNPFIISVAGNDINYEKIIRLCNEENIFHSIFIDNKRNTTSKNRITCQNIICSRYDIEDTFEIDNEIENKMIEHALKQINEKKIDGIILSDYNKGLLTENLCQQIIDIANNHNIPTFIDPKVNNVKKYKNCTLFKPNLAESALISDKDCLYKKIIDIYNKISCKIVLITLGKDGMIYYDGSIINKVVHNSSINCIDATGAGDTVMSAFVFYYIMSKNLNKTITFCNFIGSKSVQQMGNYIMSITDVYEFEHNNKFIGKQLYITDLAEFRKLNLHKKIIFTNGCFDIVHTAHLKLLKFCKQQGDILIIGLNSDKSIKRLKGESRPINSEIDRSEFLKLLDFVDYVVLFDTDTPYELLSQLNPDALIKGGDYKIETIIGKEFAKEVILYDLIKGKSTSNIIQKIKNN